MDGKMNMWLALIIVGMLCVNIAVIHIYHKREKNLIKKLQTMIDSMADGTYDVETVDETTLSALENSMNRFLADCDVSSKNLSSQKEKVQTLISDISHQTLTPISNILLYTQLLEEKGHEDEFEISAIKEQTEKLNFLIDTLVKISRLENGIITVKPEINCVQELLDKAVKQVQPKADKKGITIKAKSVETVAFFDPKWTAEALYNILDNAMKYTTEGGNVKIDVIPYSFFYRINISDNGIGIAENEFSKIFGRFYRSQAVSEEEGIGIGLYLAREIISAQGGYIKVASKEGEGSIFSVFLCRKVSKL